MKKEEQNARQFRHRQELSRRQVLKALGGIIVLPVIPFFSEDELDTPSYWRWLRTLQDALNWGNVPYARQGAANLILSLDFVKPGDTEFLRLYALEILRDAGAEGNNVQTFARAALPYAKLVQQGWRNLGKFEHYAGALLQTAEIYKLLGKHKKVLNRAKAAEFYAHKADPGDQRREVAALLHEAIRYQVRLTGKRMAELATLAEHIDLPQTWFHTKRTEVHFLTSTFDKKSCDRGRTRIDKLLSEIEELFPQVGHSDSTYLYLLNARLAFYRLAEESTKQDKVIEEFRTVFARRPDAYQLAAFKRLTAGKHESATQDLKGGEARIYLASDLLSSLPLNVDERKRL
jgi:hypothetical protein